MQKEWINIDINVTGIIKLLLTIFLSYLMGVLLTLATNVTLELRSWVTLVPRVNNTLGTFKTSCNP